MPGPFSFAPRVRRSSQVAERIESAGIVTTEDNQDDRPDTRLTQRPDRSKSTRPGGGARLCSESGAHTSQSWALESLGNFCLEELTSRLGKVNGGSWAGYRSSAFGLDPRSGGRSKAAWRWCYFDPIAGIGRSDYSETETKNQKPQRCEL